MQRIIPSSVLRVILCVICTSFFSCSFFDSNEEQEGIVVAQVFDKKLFNTELASVIPVNTSAEDSARISENYISNWVSNQVVLHKAMENLADEAVLSEIQKKMEDYRNSLIRFAYEKELVQQKLDTIVSDAEIESYYNNNKANFELKDNIIKVIYLKLRKNAPKMSKVKEWYKSVKPKDRAELENYCFQFAENYFLDDTSWLLFDDLLKEIPIKTYDKEQFLKNNRYIEIADSNYIYLVNIQGFRIKDSLSPIVFERENIINIILNKRKLKLIEEMEKSAYLEAEKNNEIMLPKSNKTKSSDHEKK